VALTTSNLQIHYDFSNSSCYPGSGTAVTNLVSGGSAYNGTINADSIRAGTSAGTVPTYSSANSGIITFAGNKGRITIPHGTYTAIPNNSVNRTLQMWVYLNNYTDYAGGTAAGLFGKLSTNSGFDGYVGNPKFL
jgi:hypothetical protein